jgi:glycine/D-amino acid oxidase-like deaminating enzyme
MTTHLQVAVIGGGVTGTAILLALAREGLTDCMLFERTELTAGATWHSSGHIAHYTTSPLLTGYAARTSAFVRSVMGEVDQDVSLIDLGSLRLATSREAYDTFGRFVETTGGLACDARMLSAQDVADMWPLAHVEDTFGAMHVAADCRLNPADLTQAYARAARQRGATVRRGVEVTELKQRPGGGWTLSTSDGTWTADHVVTASGIFARRTLPMLGVDLPVAVVSHQYLVTEPVPEIVQRRANGAGPLPILRQPDIGMNIREEGDGFCISLYEQNATTVFPDGPPERWGMELFPEDFDSIEAGFLTAMERVPCLGEAGIRTTVHGPMPWSPDFFPMIGPVPGVQGLWVAEAMSYGVTWSGAAAEILASWIAHGDPGEDTSAVSPARFGAYAKSAWADERALGTYKGVYGDGAKDLSVPQSEGHDILLARGAQFKEHDGRALATHVDAIPASGPEVAICVLPQPHVLRAQGVDLDAVLARVLSDFVPPTPTQEGGGWLLSPRGTILAHIRTVMAEPGGAIDLILDAGCPRGAADTLRSRCPNLNFNDQPDEALIVMGRDPDMVARALSVPNDLVQGHVVSHNLGAGGQASRSSDLDGHARWYLRHPNRHHRAVLEALMDALPTAAILGHSDYESLRISAGEARVGHELDANTTPTGTRISGAFPGEPARADLCRFRIAERHDARVHPDTILRDADDAIVGRIVSVTLEGNDLIGIAAVSPEAQSQDGPISVRIGETDHRVMLRALAVDQGRSVGRHATTKRFEAVK